MPGCVHGRPRRWVVERTNSWHNRFRGLLIRWERKASRYLAFCLLTSALIALNVAAKRERMITLLRRAQQPNSGPREPGPPLAPPTC